MLHRTLLLVRHAETESPRAGQEDFHRQLTERGREDAGRVARQLRALHYQPERILASTALRARQTAAILTEDLNCTASTLFYQDALYYAGEAGLRDALLSLPDDLEQVHLVAHNPAISDFGGRLCAERLYMSPCSVACITGGGNSWAEFIGEGARLKQFIDPGSLRNGT